MKFETVMGLEVHVELDTNSKIYCGCTTAFGGEENTHCCPGCIAMPGMLPALNERVVEFGVRAGLALNCQINEYSIQDRKHYFYPDLPRAFQTSQLDLPVCTGGYVDIVVDGETKRIGITRIHIEEDAGKLLHEGNITRVDLNRSGMPLIEIVTEPDFRSPEDLRAFLEELRSILIYTGVSKCKMEEGSMRCDVNLSVRPEGQKEYGVRTEMKNLNSLSAVVRAAQYERSRQIKTIESGGELKQVTLRWDDLKGTNTVMRTKETAGDYFYFPEPDIAPIVLTKSYIDEIRDSIPELPAERRQRYTTQLGLSDYDARLITASKKLSDVLDGCVAMGANAKQAANYILSDISRVLNEKSMEPEELPINSEQLYELISLVEKGVISRTIGSKLIEMMFEENLMPSVLVEKKGLSQVSDEGEITSMCAEVYANNPKSVEDFKAGKDKALTSLVGQVMKASKGKANPALVNKILLEMLAK